MDKIPRPVYEFGTRVYIPEVVSLQVGAGPAFGKTVRGLAPDFLIQGHYPPWVDMVPTSTWTPRIGD
jgi:hypothetical protein